MDTSIIATADDAVFTKNAAVQAGYYEDPYISYFYDGIATANQSPHIQPIIKRGTHARVMCVDHVISNFLEENCQIVILGAGKDTTYFRHRKQKKNVVWFEVDHEIVVKNKLRTIQQNSQAFDDVQIKDTKIVSMTDSSSSCHLICHDLRESPKLLLDKMVNDGFSVSKRTLFVAECVQMYMEESCTRTLWEYFAKEQQHFSIVLYDPILGRDSQFGRIMEENLHSKRKVLSKHSSGLETRTLENHLDKFISSGWNFAMGCDMWTAYQYFLTNEERQKANACEFLDEIEEWMLIMQHYCLVIAVPSKEHAVMLLRGLDPHRCLSKKKCTSQHE